MATKRKFIRLIRLISLIGLVVIVIPIFFLIFSHPTSAGWFNDNWLYRTRITIGNTGSADSNKKVKFDIDTATLITAGKLQSDCGDSRFTDVNGQLLRYYIDTSGGACNDASTDYYVLMPTINAGNTDIYHYYGNSSVVNGTEAAQFSQATFSPTSGPTLATEEKATAASLYLRFDEGYGTSARDAMEQSNNGSISGATWQQEGICKIGMCLSFDGTDDVVTITNAKEIDFDTGLVAGVTFSFWVRVNSDGESSVGEIVDKGATTYIRVTNEGSDGLADLEVSIDLGTTDATATVTNGITLNRWQHISVGYTDDGDDEVTVYIDGISRGSSTLGSGAPATSDTNNLLIGGDTLANFHGFVDEFKVYNFERSAAQVKLDALTGGSNEGVAALFGSNSSLVSDGLSGYWKLDESSGNASDSSGNASTLTDGSTTTYAAGKFANGADLEDTSTDYLYAADNAYLSITGDLTISAWIKPESVTASTQFDIAGKFDGSNESYLLSQFGDEIRMYIDSSSNYQETSAANLAAATSYHVAATYKASTQTVTIFVNGVISASSTTGTIPTSIGDDAGRFHIGAEDSTTATANYYDGIVDEVRVYSRTFSPDEVRRLYEWAPGPVVYWNLDENTGTSSVNDVSGTSNTGTMTGTMTASDWVSGKFGSALDFDGTDDALTIATAADASVDFNGSEAFSGSAWVYITTMPGSGNQDAIITKYDQTSTLRAYRLIVENDDADTTGNFQIDIYDESADQTISATGANDTVSQNTWYHVSFTFNGGVAGAADDLKLYTNAVLTGTNSANASFLGLEDIAVDFSIGDYDTTDAVANNTAFTGIIDDVKVYNYVRTPAQIIEDMNAGHPVGGSPVGSPVGYWKFDEGSLNRCSGGANDFCDQSVNANDLAFVTTTGGFTNSGKFGKALNGTNAVWANRNDDADFDFSATEDFSISLWIKSDSATNPGAIEYIVSKARATTAGYAVYTDTSGFLCFGIDDDTTWGPDITSCTTTDFYDNTWHHIAAIRDYTSSDKTYIYVDGIQRDSDSDTTSATLANAISFVVADFDDTDNGDEFTGDVDELKIYRAVLTPDQIKTEYNQGKAEVLGALGSNTSYQISAAAQEYCVPGDSTSCSGPIGEWKLDEATGTTFYDTSTNGKNGSLANGPTTWVSGKKGKAFSFNGTTSTIAITNTSTPPTQLTMEAWIYPKSGGEGSTGPVLYDGRTNGGGSVNYFFNVSSSNLVRFRVNCATDGSWTTPNNSITFNTWQHIAATYDVVDTADCSATDPVIYINGITQTLTETTPSGAFTNSTQDWVIGANTNSGNPTNTFDGYIDDVKYFNYIRTPAQIAWDYNRGGPIGWWKFDECSGTTLNDSAGNSNSLTATIAGSGNTSAGTCSSGTATEAWNNGTTGKFGSSLDFDGADDYAERSDDADFDFNDRDFAITGWFNRDTATTDDIILAKRNSFDTASDTGYIVYLDSSGDNLIFEVSDGTDEYTLTSSSTFTSTGWNHFAIVWDDDSNLYSKIYINGKLDTASQTGTIGNIGDLSNSIALRLASESDGANYLDGKLDDVRIYNYVLTPEQIKMVYNEGSSVRFGN